MKKKFTLFKFDDNSNIFLIIEEHNRKLPLIVHGIIRVEGKNYENSSCARNHISDELTISGELKRLEYEAQIKYFNVD